MYSNLINTMIVRRAPGKSPFKGLLEFDGKSISCCLGKNGISTNKFEGDQKTPAGSFKLLYGFYRQDRLGILHSQLPLINISKNMGWCDEPLNANYNRPVTLPFTDNCEELSRSDRLYDICLVMDHNYSSRIKGRGSAVFFHLTNIEQGPTQGCVAIEPKWMLQLLSRLSNKCMIKIIA